MKLFIALFAALLLSATSAADARGYNYGGGHHSGSLPAGAGHRIVAGPTMARTAATGGTDERRAACPSTGGAGQIKEDIHLTDEDRMAAAASLA